jgi:hypothetical protein
MMIAEVLKDDFFSEEEMARMMRIKVATLKRRIATGTEHPPYVEIGRERLFPRDQFREWARNRKVIYEVKSAS